MTTLCTSCGKPVRFVRTSGGGRMPLDPEPVPQHQGASLVVVDAQGVVVPAERARALVASGRALVMVARRAGRSIDPDLPHWRSHFVTCPYAPRHRKRQGRTTLVEGPTQERLL